MLETSSTTALSAVREPVRERLGLVEEELGRMVPADFEAIDEVGGYLFSVRGKLFRPTLLLLANEIGGRPSPQAVKLAAVVELLHVATLVHDDAVDHSVRRRGMPTVNARWNHRVAIIMGDYLYSRAVIEVTRLGDLEAVDMLARTANRMTVGEMRQLVSHDALDFSREDYFRLCEAKTATLLATACELGAMAGVPAWRERLREFGFELGMAFQITDDLLDYTTSSTITGKPRGQDLREHKVTLPLIEALPAMDEGRRRRIAELFADPEPDDGLVEAANEAVEAAGGLSAARTTAEGYARRAREALSGMPAGAALEALHQAVDYVLDRER